MKKQKAVKDVIMEVNKTLTWYKKGGWVDTRRTPSSGPNYVNSLEEYVEARFNREMWEVPEVYPACELLDGRLFSCRLDECDEMKKRFKIATLTLIDVKDIENPTPELEECIKRAREFIGGNEIIFNSVKVKVKYDIRSSDK